MKRFTLLIIAFVCLAKVFANDIENNLYPTSWNCLNFYKLESRYSLFIDGDTIINDTIYGKLYHGSSRLNVNLIGEIRFSQDYKKIYIRQNNKEKLLFDFDVQIGDTCHVFAGFDTIPNLTLSDYPDDIIDLVVTDISYEKQDLPDITSARLIYLSEKSHINDSKYSTIWIDGIGSIHGLYPIRIEDVPDSIPSTTLLLCARNNNRQIYLAPEERFYPIFPLATEHWSSMNPEPQFVFKVGCDGLTIFLSIDNESKETDTDAPLFNILGLQVSKEYKGIVLQNGKKIIKI